MATILKINYDDTVKKLNGKKNGDEASSSRTMTHLNANLLEFT